MKLRELDSLLKDTLPPSQAHRTLDKISHWLEKMKVEKKYETGLPQEMKALKKLESLGLVKIKDKGMTIEVAPTEEAEGIHKEMVARGFFLKKGKV